MLRLNMIVAMTRERGIGFHGDIPWHYSSDLKRFRRLTSDCPIIMGRKTWESLPVRPLPGRLNIVLTRDVTNIVPQLPGMIVVESPDEALEIITNTGTIRTRGDRRIENIAWVIGGQAIYELFINSPFLENIDCTIVPDAVKCDTFFPEIPEHFQLISSTIGSDNLIHHNYHRQDSQQPTHDDPL